jgi:O-antigen ligase
MTQGTRALQKMGIIFGFPILIVVAYSSVSDVLRRAFGIPSVLQATVVLLALIVWFARSDLRPLGMVLQPMTLLLIAYCALLFISSAWAVDLPSADFRVSEAAKGLVILIIGAALMPSWARVRAGLATLVIVAASLAAISVVQIAVHLSNDLGGLVQVQAGNLYGSVSHARAAGPVSDPNFYGQILLITIPIAAFLAASSERRRSKVLFGVVAAVIFAGVMVTYSRGAMLSVLAMLLLVPFVIPVRGRVILRTAIAALLLMAVMPSAVVRRFETVTDIVSRRDNEPEDSRDASVDKRRLLFNSGVLMFEDAPLFGVGAGNFGRHYWHYAYEAGSAAAQYDDPGERQFPHSLYVELAAENGMVGLGCFLAAMAAAFLSLTRSRRALATRGASAASLLPASITIALAGYLVSSIFLHSAYQRYLWLLLAFAPAMARLAREPEEAA